MNTERTEQILRLNEDHLLADVLGFETDEVAFRADGPFIDTYLGERIIDFTGGIAVHACGHNHTSVVEAIREQLGEVIHTSDTMRHRPQLELADFLRNLFAEISQGEPWQFLFMNSGSESIDSAAKLALKATGRTKFIAFEGAFHGRTLFASALSRSKKIHWNAYEPFLEPLRANILHVPTPRGGLSGKNQSENFCIERLEQILKDVGNETAAIFFEAQQGEGGYFPMSPAFGRRLRELTNQYGILLIADEIQSGFGRTGRWFAFEHLGIVPDMVVVGKAIGGGLPLAGIAAPKSLMERWQAGEHGTTFGGNPLACAAGHAALKTIKEEELIPRAAQLGAKMKSRLQNLAGQYGIHEARGNGFMIGVEIRNQAGEPDYHRVDKLKHMCREAGLLLLSCGANIGNPHVDNAALRLLPPLNIPLDVLNNGLDIITAALKKDSA